MTAHIQDAALVARLAAVLEATPWVGVAFAFGSVARGTARRGSDLDVAVLPVTDDVPLAEELDLALRLEAASGRSVDLVRLDRATASLAWQVARDGVVLLSRQPGAAARFRAHLAIARDLDAELDADARRRYRAALIREPSTAEPTSGRVDRGSRAR